MERVPKERSCAEAREQKIENVRKRIRRMKTEFRKLLEEAIVVRVCWQSEREKARVLKCFAWAKLSLATEGLSHALSPFQFLNPNNYNFRVLSLRRPLAAWRTSSVISAFYHIPPTKKFGFLLSPENGEKSILFQFVKDKKKHLFYKNILKK